MFLTHIDSPGTIFRTNHASNYVVLAGNFNEDIPKMLAQLEDAKKRQRYRLEEWRRHILSKKNRENSPAGFLDA